MKKANKGAAKKVAPKKLIATTDFYTVINGQKCRGNAGDELFLKGPIKDQLISIGFVEEK